MPVYINRKVACNPVSLIRIQSRNALRVGAFVAWIGVTVYVCVCVRLGVIDVVQGRRLPINLAAAVAKLDNFSKTLLMGRQSFPEFLEMRQLLGKKCLEKKSDLICKANSA